MTEGEEEFARPIQDPFGVAVKGGGGVLGKGGGGVQGKAGGELLRFPGLSAEAVGAIPRGMGSKRAPRSI